MITFSELLIESNLLSQNCAHRHTQKKNIHNMVKQVYSFFTQYLK